MVSATQPTRQQIASSKGPRLYSSLRFSVIDAVVRDTAIVKNMRLEVVEAMTRLQSVEDKFDKRIEGGYSLDITL